MFLDGECFVGGREGKKKAFFCVLLCLLKNSRIVLQCEKKAVV